VAARRPTTKIDDDCGIIMSPEFTEIGIGDLAGGSPVRMWTQVFAAP